MPEPQLICTAVVWPNGHLPTHETGPTWCWYCGTFDVHFGTTACREVGEGDAWWRSSSQRPAHVEASPSAFSVGQIWDLGVYGQRRIESVEKRYVPFPSSELMCAFGMIDTPNGPAALVVGEKTLRSSYVHIGGAYVTDGQIA